MNTIKHAAKPNKNKYIKLIKLACRRVDFEAAIRHCKRFINIYPDKWEPYYYLASVYGCKNESKQETDILKKGISKVRNNYFLFLRLGKIMQKKRKHADAVALFHQLIREHPFSWEGYVYASESLIKLKKVDDARTIIEKGLVSCPTKMNILKSASTIYRAFGRRRDSLIISLRFVVHHNTNHIGYVRSAEDFCVLGNYNDAKQILLRGIKIIPKKTSQFLNVYLNIIDIHYLKHEYSIVRQEAEFLRLHYPDFWHGHAISIRMCILDGELHTAAVFLQHAEKLFSGNKHFVHLYGEFYRACNEFVKITWADNAYINTVAKKTGQTKSQLPITQDEIKAKILQCFKHASPAVFTEIGGNANFIPPQHATELNKHLATIIFDMFESACLEYYIFAGSMIGYLRDRSLPVWSDDIDVLIFKESESTFTDCVVPLLLKLGFKISPVRPVRGEVGGYQIHFPPFKVKAFYDDSTQIKIWPFQLDVFITVENCLGYAKNVKGWGLYHEKDIPARWIRPGRKVVMLGKKISAFREYEKDIMHEYGDIFSSVVISSHINQGTTYVHIDAHWANFSRIFNYYYYLNVKRLPPIVSEFIAGKQRRQYQASIDDESAETFSDLCKLILSFGPKLIILTKPTSFIWIFDLKKIFPSLSIRVCLDSIKACNMIASIIKYVDEVSLRDQSLLEAFQARIDTLKYIDAKYDKHVDYFLNHCPFSSNVL